MLNPPGGSSSNIFGTDDQPQQRAAPVRSNQDRSNVQGQGQQAAASSPANPQQAKSRVPRSGDGSFHSPFGSYQASSGSHNSHLSGRVSSPSQRGEFVRKNYGKPHVNSQDTFFNIFGEGGAQRKQMFRSVLNKNDDSFSRVFGYCSASGSRGSSEPGSFDSVHSVGRMKESSQTCAVKTSAGCFNNSNKKEEFMGSPLRRAVGRNVSYDITPVRRRRFSDRGGRRKGIEFETVWFTLCQYALTFFFFPSYL